MKIYKYELTSSNQMYISKVKMPMVRKPISVGEQDNKLVVWAEIDDSGFYIKEKYVFIRNIC